MTYTIRDVISLDKPHMSVRTRMQLNRMVNKGSAVKIDASIIGITKAKSCWVSVKKEASNANHQ